MQIIIKDIALGIHFKYSQLYQLLKFTKDSERTLWNTIYGHIDSCFLYTYVNSGEWMFCM